MARLGTKQKPAIIRVQTEERAMEISRIFEEHGWIYIAGIEPDKHEDISDLEKLLNPQGQQARSSKVARNDPCPCGSGKKHKKCCGSSTVFQA